MTITIFEAHRPQPNYSYTNQEQESIRLEIREIYQKEALKLHQALESEGKKLFKAKPISSKDYTNIMRVIIMLQILSIFLKIFYK